MTFGITFNNNYYTGNKASGLDHTALQETAREIFKNAQAASVNTNSANSAKISNLQSGVDFYNGKVSPEMAKNISLQNAGLNIYLNSQVIANIQYLNLQAAKATTESFAKNMEGKVYVQNQETIANSEREYAPLPNSTTFFNIGNLSKDKRGGGNPFYSGAESSNNDSNSEETSIN